MSKRTGKILKAITGGLVAVVSLVAFLLVGVRLVGLQVYTVLSGSMEPDYPTGSLVYVKAVDPAELEVGDVITFLLSRETTATHRIVEILPDENDPNTRWFRTKGDANEVEDANPVLDANVVGTPLFVIPYLGYITDFIQKPPGLYLAISAGLILVILVFMVDYITADKGDKKPKKTRDFRKEHTPHENESQSLADGAVRAAADDRVGGRHVGIPHQSG